MLTQEKHWDRQLVRELREVYGDDADVSIFHGRHHARYFRDDTTYHIVARIMQGYCFMRPDKWFNNMAAGVVGRAMQNFKSIELYAFAFMSSHLHLQLRGSPEDIARFVGFIKGEISRRLGQRIGWRGAMWDGRYLATALPTAESEVACLEYILAQGVKEHLVGRSTAWPGLHAAKQLSTGNRLVGEWLDGTAYGRAKYEAERRRAGSAAARVNPRDHTVEYSVELAVLPAWRRLSTEERQANVQAMLARIEQRGRDTRKGKKPLGAKGVLATPRRRSRSMPAPPWFETRRKMICWADRRAPETRAYLDAYWEYQRAFRAASAAFCAGDLTVAFPPNAYSPPLHRPPPD